MENRKELNIWRQERMKKGYTFEYLKGYVNGDYINTAIECIETDEIFEFEWN